MNKDIRIGDDCPWTCGDSQTALELGEPLGHTEILTPLYVGDEIVAYMPWEPLASPERQYELRKRTAATLDALAILC